MVVCPPLEILDQLLAGNLPENDSQKLASHIEECIHCQAVLDNQTAMQCVIPGINCGLNQTAQADDGWTADRIKRFARKLFVAQSASLDNDHHSTNPYSMEEFALPEIPGYRVQKVIGQGGMGIVLKARHLRMQRDVAIKILPATALQDETAVSRFSLEAQAIAALSHPNIVTAFDAGVQDDLHYLVMEYIEGWDLAEVANLYNSLNVADAVECIIQAARGLHHAHLCKMTHRDIKPSNLILDRFGNIKVLDLGLARFTQILLNDYTTLATGQLTHAGQFMGSVDYMAPEQVMDARLADHRSDIYSLGCTLYRILTRESLFTGDTLMQRIMAHREQDIPALKLKRSDIPLSLENVFRKMVAKTPEDRQQSMTEVIDELQLAMADEQSIGQPNLQAVVERLNHLHDVNQENTRDISLQATVIPSSTSQDLSVLLSPALEPQPVSLVAESKTKDSEFPGYARQLLAAMGLFSAVLICAAVVYLKLGKHEVQITLDDPEISLSIDGETVVIDEGNSPIRLTAGPHAIKVEHDGLSTETDEFHVKANGRNVIHVTIVDETLRIIKNDIPPIKPAIAQNKTKPQSLTGEQQKFLENLRLLPTDLQRQEVVAKLKQINGITEPIYDDPKGLRLPEFELENENPVFVKIADWRMSLLWPLQAFPSLRSLDLSEVAVSDLTPLTHLPNLTELKIELAVYNPDADNILRSIQGLKRINDQPAEKYFENREKARREIDVMSARVNQFSPEVVAGWLESQLKKFNPEFTGHVMLGNPHNRENHIGYWQEGDLQCLDFYWISNITDISPVRALPCDSFTLGSKTGGDQLTTHRYDLSPLKGLSLETLSFVGRVRDLQALRGMPLKNLSIYGPVTDLTPLNGMPLESISFDFHDIPLTDLSPLRNAPLHKVDIHRTLISDLSLLADKDLTYLSIYGTPITDISLLKGMPLKHLVISGWRYPRIVADISVMAGMPLTHLGVHVRPYFEPELQLLKSLPLERHPLDFNISIDQFWQEFNDERRAEAAFIASLAKLPVNERASAVEEKLGKPEGFNYVVNKGAVTEVTYNPYFNESLSLWPLRAFLKLKKLTLSNSERFNRIDLSPLIDLPIEELHCGGSVEYNVPVIRQMSTLKSINGQPISSPQNFDFHKADAE
ncbi:MAG TPA: hypothetical protein DD473_12395 [Planctomycetaceae bacterium]|nr:hypothetical protein [Planctomycetaceae bacterium]